VVDVVQAAFPIVGIGASAGGLEAVEKFFSGVPVDSGMAFMLVQQITERMPVQANHIYVIPPGFDLSILHGVLHLLEPMEPRGLRLPIDYFFRSLAQDQKERSIGVVLSGMGSDGILGLRAIKEQVGAAFVQSAAPAKFDGLPLSVINGGLADVVAPVDQLAAHIISYLRHVSRLMRRAEVAMEDPNQSGLEKVLLLLRAQTGQDFSLYKKSTLYRRMAVHRLHKIADYVRFLRVNP
jgi:two-component system CheB/CheR fusion protein